MAGEWRPILRRKFDDEASSFIFCLRRGSEKYYNGCGNIERWTACGFGFLPRRPFTGDREMKIRLNRWTNSP